jgi:hypothetical protein
MRRWEQKDNRSTEIDFTSRKRQTGRATDLPRFIVEEGLNQMRKLSLQADGAKQRSRRKELMPANKTQNPARRHVGLLLALVGLISAALMNGPIQFTAAQTVHGSWSYPRDLASRFLRIKTMRRNCSRARLRKTTTWSITHRPVTKI